MITESPDFVELTQQKYMRYYESTSLFDVGLQISTEHINLVAMIDPQQDVYTYFTETQWTNIPYVGNSFYAIADMNWTKLGFIEFDYGNFYVTAPLGEPRGFHGVSMFLFLLHGCLASQVRRRTVVHRGHLQRLHFTGVPG